MRLRNFSTRPTRLGSMVKSSSRPLPAAFPSKSHRRFPREAQEEEYQSSGERQQVGNDGNSERVSPSAQENRPTTNIPSEASYLNFDENNDSMQTSPLRAGRRLPLTPVRWSILDEGLQMYIFDSLQSQYKHTDVVARMLGLDTAELRDLLYLRNHRATHPFGTDQLWEHCLSLTEGDKGYVDPWILNQYMPYFTFAESFETASIYQRRLAKAFLNQCEINGPWVDALLQDQSGIWNRPEGNSAVLGQLRTGVDDEDGVRETPNSTDADEVSWQTTLQDVRVHESHDLDRMAPHFKSPYFPACVRDELLKKTVSVFDPCDYWLMYAQSDVELGDLRQFVGAFSGKALDSQKRQLHPVLYFLKTLVADRANQLGLHQKSMEFAKLTALYTYATARVLIQLRLIRKEIERMPTTPDDKLRMLEAAGSRCTSSLLRDIDGRVPPHAVFTPQSRSRSPTSSGSSTLVDDGATPTTVRKGNVPESRATTPSEPSSQFVEPKPHAQERFPPMGVGISQRSDKLRSDMLLTTTTLPMSKHIQYHPKPADGTAEFDYTDVAGLRGGPYRSPSVSSFHTARDEDEDVVMTAPPRYSKQPNSKSPVPPPWSPISDVEFSSTTLHDATATSDKQEEIGQTLPRTTPWLSTRATTSLAPVTDEKRCPPVGSRAITPPLAVPSLLAGIEQHAKPVHQSQNLHPWTTTSTSPSKTPIKQASFPIYDVVQTPSNRPAVPPGSSTAHTKKARERTGKPPVAQPQPVKSKPTTKLMTKLLSQESQKPAPHKPKLPRSDKGKTRGKYMTKERRAEAAARAEAEAKAASTADIEGVQPASTVHPREEGQ
ncbi:hypothetical protein LTR70_000281 [Exophiala xenobiotica]|uniref:Uncharacterized protein n=1 Tax=Lithohypha guttulata TaxID=1690604 RepID=A0ABR0K603_9EURO|nr:hypothetical protein LTR24_006744 [Lithohypha guttulata]KAK5330959.1 hypothetical protein LTR70_000281 [Exophiala xenobiotica]